MSVVEDGLVTATRGGVARALAGDAVRASAGVVEIIMAAKEPATEEEMQELVDAAKVCKVAHKALDDQRKTITAPLKQAMDAANDLANPHLRQLKSAMDRVKALYDVFTSRQRAEALRKQREEQERANAEARRIAEEVAKGNIEDDDDVAPAASVYVPPPPTIVKGGIGKMHVTTKRTLIITDLVAAARAYPELLEVKVKNREGLEAFDYARRTNPEAELEGFKLEVTTSSALT